MVVCSSRMVASFSRRISWSTSLCKACLSKLEDAPPEPPADDREGLCGGPKRKKKVGKMREGDGRMEGVEREKERSTRGDNGVLFE